MPYQTAAKSGSLQPDSRGARRLAVTAVENTRFADDVGASAETRTGLAPPGLRFGFPFWAARGLKLRTLPISPASRDTQACNVGLRWRGVDARSTPK